MVSEWREKQFQEALAGICAKTVDKVDLTGRKLAESELRQLVQALEGNDSVTELYLDLTGIGGCAAEALATLLPHSAVERLYLQGNEIQCKGVKALAETLKDSSLSVLGLSQNAVRDEGAQALACSLKNSKLTFLNLAHNRIGDLGMKALAAGIQDAPLERLNLSYNSLVTVEGVKVLAAALRQSNIVELGLICPQLGEEAAQALLEGARDTSVKMLLLGSFGYSSLILQQINEALEANKARSFLLQMQVEGEEAEWSITFRTVAGTVAAVMSWSADRPVKKLPEAVFSAMRASDSQLLDRHLRAHNLRIVKPDGALLDVTDHAANFAEQVRKRTRL